MNLHCSLIYISLKVDRIEAYTHREMKENSRHLVILSLLDLISRKKKERIVIETRCNRI
jgi:hypothetical protein